jgi:hypothetical protein
MMREFEQFCFVRAVGEEYPETHANESYS